jgi:diguanylate cyclase (GGDEF)-like protein
MRTVALLLVLLAAIGSWSPPALCAQLDLESLIRQAESSKSAAPDVFPGLLKTLEARKDATALQRLEIRYLRAWAEVYAGRFDSGVEMAKQVLDEARDRDLKLRCGVLIVNAYALNGHFNEGLRQLDQTLALAQQVTKADLRQTGELAAATLYNQLGQHDLARRYAEMVEPRPSTPRLGCFAGYLKFEALLHLDTMPADDAPILHAIGNCKHANETVMANLVRATLARQWIRHDGSERAMSLLEAHLPEAEGTHYPRLIAEFRSLIAELQYARGDLLKAESNAKEAATYSDGLANTPLTLVSAYSTLYRIAETRHDPAAALAYYKLFARAEKGYLQEVKARDLAYQLVRQETEQKNQQIQLLNRQNGLLQLQQRVEQQKAANSRLLMLCFALFTLLTVYWAYKTKRMQMSVRRMAETDALTGICNRHHFTNQAEKALAQCERSGEQVSLIMFDLDHFKSINDNYGHVTGDWVLKEVAKTCSELCRPVDYFGRLGGEEFAILLRGCDQKAATRIADDCRMRIARIESSESGFGFQTTASFGVTSTKTSKNDLDKLMSQADQMLYRAKREGRNRVKAYTLDVPFDFKDHDSRQPSERPEPVVTPERTSA